SGKSFIPMLIGVGCGVPGVMASRTIENERDRRMTIMTTTFIPCGAKVPFIGMIAGALFGGSAWVSTSAYFIGMAAIIVSGIMLKKTKMFAGDPAPFVMELPAYHWPTLGNVLRSMWERGWSFIKKAGTIILLSTILVWFTTYFGTVDGTFRMLSEDEIDYSILAAIGGVLAWIFKPLGWGNWQAAVASITGLVAKENIVGTLGILYGGGDGTVYQNIAAAFNGISGYSFLVFNLLCAPCFAAIGAIKREMNSQKWTWFAIGYQCWLRLPDRPDDLPVRLRLHGQPERDRPHLRDPGTGRHHLHAGASLQGSHHAQGLSLSKIRKRKGVIFHVQLDWREPLYDFDFDCTYRHCHLHFPFPDPPEAAREILLRRQLCPLRCAVP
ncbi:ferrous iron transporter FeoB, partial [human gut metagenome]